MMMTMETMMITMMTTTMMMTMMIFAVHIFKGSIMLTVNSKKTIHNIV